MSSVSKCARCGKELAVDSIHVFCISCFEQFKLETALLTKYYSPPKKAVEGVQLLLEGLKETYPLLEINNGHFDQTPHRVARMFVELCWGLAADPVLHLTTAFEESRYRGIVFVGNIKFTSLCMHHFAIFRGIVHAAYIPDGRIVGLSKINRVVEIIAARPQVQEQLTYQIADVINSTLKPQGVAVVCEASHDCIEVRGVRSKGSVTKTSEMRGVFASNAQNCKGEFFSLIKNERI